MRRMVIGAVLPALLALSAACGGSGNDSRDARADDRGDSATTSTTTGKDGTGGGSGTGPGRFTAPEGGTSPTGNGGSTSTTGPNDGGGGGTPSSGPVRAATIDRRCVRQGVAADEQGITVRHLKPGELMGYATVYSDGSTKMSNGSYTTGEDNGKAGPDGVYRATWVVPASAPLGKATVHLVTFEKVEPMELAFTIVAATERCP